MNAYGMAGLGQGINQGIQNVTQGMVSAQNEADRRVQVQQQAQLFEQTYKNSQLQQQDYEAKLAQTQLALENLQKDTAKKDTWDVLSGYEQSGDASILNTIKNNKLMDNMLKGYGISGFSNISDLTPEKQQSLGITPEMLQDPTKRIVLAYTTDGRQVPMDMMKIYATTGFLPKLGEQKLAEITMQANEAKAKLEAQSSNDALKWLQANPGKTYQDYTNLPKLEEVKLQGQYDVQQEAVRGKYDLLKEEARGKYEVLKEATKGQDIKKTKDAEDYKIENIINADIDKFVNTIKTSDKTDTVNVEGTPKSLYAMAKSYEDKQPQQLDVGYKNELRGKRNVIQGTDRIIAKLDNIKDWNIGTKAASEIERIVGDFTISLTDDKASNGSKGDKTISDLKSATKNMPEQDRLYMESYVFPVVADYIKAMSGAAVSEQERTAYVSNMTSGWMASKSAFKSSVTGFRESVSDSFTGMMDSIAPSYPKTYLDLKMGTDSKEVTSSKETPSVQTKEWNGKTFKLINNQWVEQVGN